MKKILIAACLLVITAQAAQLKSLKFEGLIHLSPEVASEMIGIKEGDTVDIEKIDAAIKTLYKQNYFEDIWVEDTGDGALVFHFKEKPTIAQIDLSGIGENDREKVLGFLGIQKGEVYDKAKAQLAQARIVGFFEAKGYFDTVVEHTKEELNEGSITLSFLVNRGQEINIQQVNLCGAEAFDYGDIEPKIANKEAEILPWMWGFNDGKLRLGDLEYDSKRIEDLYRQYGYLDAQVSEPFLKAYLGSYSADLTYKIKEGKQYILNNVNIEIPEGLINSSELIEEMALEKGDVFDIDRLRRDVKRVENRVADLGYAYVRVMPDMQKNSEKALVDVNLRVIPGDKVYINDVRISGNSRTIDRVIRRDVFLAPGDLYNRTDLSDSRGALKRSSYFQDVQIKEQRVSRDKVDLIVEVSEAATSSIGGGIGYGSSDGLLLNANLSDANIFGSGMKASVNVERSDKELSGSISLSNPRIFDSEYSVGGSIYRNDYDFYDYDELSTGFNISVGKKLTRFWSASIGYTLEQTEYSEPGEGIILPSDGLKSAIIPSVQFNNTDDFYLPRKGMDFRTSLEYAGLGGDRKFFKSVTKFSYFYGLRDSFKYDLILRYKTQFQYANGDDNNPDEFPINEKIYMGGLTTVRGYDSKSISPKNSEGSLLGGTMMYVNTIEASFPLIDRLNMRGALFLDYGLTGQDSLDIDRAGTGLALEWVSPLGPISLIFAKPLLEESGDRTSTFEFTMGRQF